MALRAIYNLTRCWLNARLDPPAAGLYSARNGMPSWRGTNRLALPEPEVGDRLLGFLADRSLPGDDAQLEHHGVENLRVLDRFADATVDHDFLERRDLVRVGEAELVLQAVANCALVKEAKTRRRNR